MFFFVIEMVWVRKDVSDKEKKNYKTMNLAQKESL